MSPLILLIAVFAGVTGAAIAIGMAFAAPRISAAEGRLQAFTSRGAGRVESTATGLLLAGVDQRNMHSFQRRMLGIQGLIDQTGTSMTTSTFALATCGCAMGVAMLTLIIGAPLFLVALLGGGAAVLPYFYLLFLRKRRLARFAKQLPEALELISRALRAGHSLAAGISLVAEEMPDPVGVEYSKCYEEQNLGIPLEESLENLSDRVPNIDLRFFVTAVILQRQTGGDLAEILDKIGHLIRERFKLWGQIQALTGEGRLSGIVLLALPPCLFVAMYYLNPEYSSTLFTDPMGRQMLGGGIIMQFLGAIVIKKIINIKV
jgi:tight adherence protein B